MFVVTAAIHGNEPAGTRALCNVLQQLRQRQIPIRGAMLGLLGNVGALARGDRYVSHDLNRGWLPATIDRYFAREDPVDPASLRDEDLERYELSCLYRRLFAQSSKSVFFLDLHSTSADGPPFCAIADTLRCRKIAFSLPLPVILGLEENVDGTMLSYVNELGHTSLVVEGGQHDDPRTVQNHEAAIWLTLVACRAVKKKHVPDLAGHLARLRRAAAGIPHVLETRYRHPVSQEDQFRMLPGFINFQEITRGQMLATDQTGNIHSRQNGRILMPLYQNQGEDGFFVIRTIRRFWLVLSHMLRRLRLHVLLPLLPGVSWHPAMHDTLLVNPRLARFQVVQIFHLFGFRRMTPEGRCFVFTRRRPDFRKLASDGLMASDPA
ncbi:MAG: succinylglutamate desuccinylase/aspartoacylase family protein [Planctomycetota bacterium]